MNPKIRKYNLLDVYEAVRDGGLTGFIMPLLGPNICELFDDGKTVKETILLIPDILLDMVK